MKIMKLLFLFGLFSLPLLAQGPIPNGGFENWMNGAPNSWYFSPNIPGAGTVTQSNVPHSGSSAVRLEAISFFGQTLPPILISGTGSSMQGFPYATRPASLNGYYQFSPVAQSNDSLTIIVTFFKTDATGSAFGGGTIGIGAAASSYVPFSIPIVYLQDGNPAVCMIYINIRGPLVGSQTIPHVGSFALIDDLEFSSSTGVSNKKSGQPLQFSLDQNYPNPFNPTTTIKYQLSQAGHVTLTVFDLLGREVTTLVNEVQNAGAHEITCDAHNHTSGMYFYKLTAGNFTQVKKMTLLK
ncbi:MAG: T9SS type A sorting domain-containing protein [Ignavibacteriales bacterium]|nr:T9SS type A sorting domain-containing protein [Ignavibacteriales bacterium]